MKGRVTLTLDTELLAKIDSQIDGHTIKNRSHAIELNLLRSMGQHAPQKFVILAGGQGTRLRPITYEIPKALIPIQGRTLTEHLFDLCKRHNITNIVMAVGHMKEKIKNYFKDGSSFGVSIEYIEEDKPLGTAGSLRPAKGLFDSSFIVSNGDELKDIDLERMYRTHKANKAAATIALTTVDNPNEYGVAKLDGSRILEFVEKPTRDKAPSNLINSGLYILEPEVIDIIPKGFAMFEKDVFPKLAKGGKLFGYPFSGQWMDTGNMKRYEKALKEWRGIGPVR